MVSTVLNACSFTLQQILEVGSIAEVASAQAVLSSCLSVLEAEVQCRQRAAAELREQVSKQVSGQGKASLACLHVGTARVWD
eukprot:scaffold83738_cov21-Tisochrysis_lutea.AAC.1